MGNYASINGFPEAATGGCYVISWLAMGLKPVVLHQQ